MILVRRISAWFLSLSAAAMGCGPDATGDGPACGNFDACGGKVEGGWKLTDACFIVLEQPKLDFCKTATAELHAKTANGSITFDKELYERHLQLATRLTLNLPEECTQHDGGVRACHDFNTTLSNGATLSCEDAQGGGCACNATLQSTFNDSGGYSIRGNRLGLAETVDYCVQGDKLTMRPTMSISMSGTSGVTSQLQTTFEKN